MAPAGVITKLRINEAGPLFVAGCPRDCMSIFGGLDVMYTFPAKGPVSQLILFVMDGAALLSYLPGLGRVVAPATLLWICYPKKSGAYQSDLIRMDPWQPLFDAGFRGQASISVNDDWTGMRFTNAPKAKASLTDLPPEGRVVEGIDYSNRTVTLPADAEEAMAAYAGMSGFFYTRSFTFKKEAVLAIQEAKKPETRLRRIQKLVNDLQQLMSRPR